MEEGICEVCGRLKRVMVNHFEDHLGFKLTLCQGCHAGIHLALYEMDRTHNPPEDPWTEEQLRKFCEHIAGEVLRGLKIE